MDIGELRNRLTVLECRHIHHENDDVSYLWASVACTWGKVEFGTGNNLFSKVGIGARDVTITMRDRPLNLHQALRYGAQHLFLTSLVREDGFITAKAALVTPTDWQTKGPKGNTIRFPGVLTEKYLGYQPEEPMVNYTRRYVLVTPKAVTLGPSDLVATKTPGFEGAWVVETCHILDPYKNEYEIYRREEP